MDDNFFDKDGKLKIIKQWMFRGDSYSARRDSGMINIGMLGMRGWISVFVNVT
jgi:hypothetical protein